jgi:hypothetical protein
VRVAHLFTLVTMIRALCLVVALAPTLFAGNQLVVGPPGTAPFSQIESAVQAASDGDVIVVKPGTYAPFYLDDKAITIVAASGPGSVTILGGSRVVFLSPGKTVVLSHLRFQGTAQSFLLAGHGLSVLQNQGSVRIESCELRGAGQPAGGCSFFGTGAGWHGLWVADSADVSVHGGTSFGGAGKEIDPYTCWPIFGGHGGRGIFAERSTVHVHNADVRGGNGGHGGLGGTGGAGVMTVDGSLVLSGTSVRGGAGGINIDSLLTYASGGQAVSAGGAWVLQGGELIGGQGQPVGLPSTGTTPSHWVDHGRSLEATALVSPIHVGSLAMYGAHGDVAFFAIGAASTHVPLGALGGTLLVDPLDAFVLGSVVAPPGVVGVTFGPGAVAPGATIRVAVQGMVLSSAGDLWLTNARHVALVGSIP